MNQTFQSEQLDARSEYIPNASEANGNGNGKIFELKRATDPQTLAVLDARRHLLADKRLNRSAKAFGAEIIDRALDPNFFDSKGVVSLADSYFAETFRVSVRSVYTWKLAVVAAGYIWLSERYRKNMWPCTVYHLSCLHKQLMKKTDKDGTYGGSKYRSKPPQTGMGARHPNQPGLHLAGSRQAAPERKNAEMPAIAAQNRNSLRVSPEENFGREPKPASGESRSQLRARAEENCGSEPKPASGESRNPLRAAAEANFQHKGDSVVRKSTLGVGGGEPPQDLGFEKWIKGLAKMYPKELDKLKADLIGKRRAAKTPAAEAEWERRIEAIDERLFGPRIQDAPEKPVAVKSERIAERLPTDEEILTGAEYLVSVGKADKLTEAQKKALKRRNAA